MPAVALARQQAGLRVQGVRQLLRHPVDAILGQSALNQPSIGYRHSHVVTQGRPCLHLSYTTFSKALAWHWPPCGSIDWL